MTSTTRTRHGSAVVTLPSDREILITRAFDAPAALVFKAWTTPELVRRWWGFESSPLVVCDIDLRPAGAWRYVTREADGTELGWHGTYLEIEVPRRLVSTEVFEGYPEGEAQNTLTLTERDGTTHARGHRAARQQGEPRRPRRLGHGRWPAALPRPGRGPARRVARPSGRRQRRRRPDERDRRCGTAGWRVASRSGSTRSRW